MKKITRGFTLVEVLIATFVMLLMVTTAGAVEVRYLTISNSYTRILQANYVAEQTFSLVRLIRDKNLMADPTKDSLPECDNPKGSYPNPAGCFPDAEPPPGYDVTKSIQEGNIYVYTTTDASNIYNIIDPVEFNRRTPGPISLDGTDYTARIYIYK